MMKWVRKVLEMSHDIERQRLLYVVCRELSPEIFALVRITRYGQRGLLSVNEVKLIYGEEDIDDMIPQFAMIVAEALKGGADVSIVTEVDPELLGICD